MGTSVGQRVRDDTEAVGMGELLRSGRSCDAAFAGASDASEPAAALA